MGVTTPAAVEADLGWTLGAVMRAYLRATTGALAEVPGGPRGYQAVSYTHLTLPTTPYV